MTKIDDAWLKAEANAFRNAGMENIHPAGAAQDPELAKYQRAMPNKPLTKPPGHYLTSDEGSPCERIEPEIIKWKEDSKPIIAMDFGKGDETVCVEVTARPDGEIESIRGIDTDEFKKQCEDIDNES